MIPYNELRDRSEISRGSEDDMFCASWTPSLLARIQELEDAIRGHLAHGELNGTKGHENLRAALGDAP